MATQITNYDRSILSSSDVKSKNVTIVNPEAGEEAIVRGTVLGRIPGDGNYKVLKSAAVDGSQFPKAILLADITLAAAATGTVPVALRAELNQDALVFDGTDTLATAVSDERLFDHLVRTGLYPEEINDFTDYDNQ